MDDDLQKAIEKNKNLDTIEMFSEIPMLRSPLIDTFFPKERKITVNKNWFLIGRDWYNPFKLGDRGQKLYLPFGKEVFRFLLAGSLRSGKSMHLRRLGDLAYMNNYHVCYLTDTKNEMRTSVREQHKKLQKYLDSEDDLPQGFPMKIYRPMFFKEFLGEITPPDENIYFQLPYKVKGKLTFDWIDLQLMLGLRSKDNEATNALAHHWTKANSLEELKEMIEHDDKIKKGAKNKLIMALEPLIRYKVLGEADCNNIINDLKDHIVTFNVRGFQKIAGTTTLSLMPQMYVKLILKLIVDAKSDKILKNRVLVIIDEAPVFLKSGTMTEEVIQNVVKRETHLGIYLGFASQDVEKDLPAWMLPMCRYILFPYNFKIQEVRKVFEYIDLSNPSGTWGWKRDIADILANMKVDGRTGERQWCLLNTAEKKAQIYWAYPSISEHLMTDI